MSSEKELIELPVLPDTLLTSQLTELPVLPDTLLNIEINEPLPSIKSDTNLFKFLSTLEHGHLEIVLKDLLSKLDLSKKEVLEFIRNNNNEESKTDPKLLKHFLLISSNFHRLSDNLEQIKKYLEKNQ